MIPLGTDRDPSRPTPATFSIAAACVVVAVVATIQLRGGETVLVGGGPVPRLIALLAVLPGHGAEVWRWATYAFTHDWNGIWHLIGNMIFLLAFGRAVERRIGSWGFVALFLSCSVASGLVQAALEPASVLVGASGAICGVTGAFLALFPRARVRFLNLFILLGVFTLPAPVAVGLQVFFDLYGFLGANQGVAYAAHLGGYVSGFLAMVILLRLGWLPRTEWDIVYAWKQRGRRTAMRRAVEESQKGGVWQQPAARQAPPERIEASGLTKTALGTGVAPPAPPAPDAPTRLALARTDDAAASAGWSSLPGEWQGKFTGAELIRIGNAHAGAQRWVDAVNAWTTALPKLEGGAQADDIRVLAALISWRRIGDRDSASRFLDGLRDRASEVAKSTAAMLRAEIAAS